MEKTILQNFQLWMCKRKYRPGKVITRFIARDIRRDIEIVDVSDISDGIIKVRTRTWNVLYATKGLQPPPSFGEIKRIEIKHLWNWNGERWGGPVPDSTDDVN